MCFTLFVNLLRSPVRDLKLRIVSFGAFPHMYVYIHSNGPEYIRLVVHFASLTLVVQLEAGYIKLSVVLFMASFTFCVYRPN